MSPKSTKAAKAKANKKSPKAAPPPKKVEESSEEDSSEEEEEAPAPVTKAAKGKKAAKAVEPEQSESEDDDSDEEEEEAPKKNGKKAVAAKAEEDDDDDSDDDSEEEEDKETPKKMEVDDDEQDEDDDDDDDDDEVEEGSKKRKATKDPKPAKKAKLDAEETADDAPAPTTVFVGGLPADVTEDEIKSFFTGNGVKVDEIRKHSKKPFAYVDLKKPKQLEKAVALNGETINDKEVTVEVAKQKAAEAPAKTPPKQAQAEDKSDNDRLTLFVKNISFDASEEDLEGHFEKCTQVRWPKNHDGSKKGFAFVQFEEEAHVDEAMNNLQGSDLCGRGLVLDYVGAKSKGTKSGGGGGGDRGGHRSSAEPGKTKTLIVKNLSWNTTGESLQDAFEGSSSARIVMRDGKSAGFGFVDFPDEDSCKAAADAMHDAEVDGRNVKVDFAAERGPGGGRGGGGGGFRGGRGGFGGRGGGRGGFGGRGGGFGGRGGGRGGFGGRGGRGGGRGGGFKRDGIRDFQGTKKTFD